jgi:hypothetical protein
MAANWTTSCTAAFGLAGSMTPCRTHPSGPRVRSRSRVVVVQQTASESVCVTRSRQGEQGPQVARLRQHCIYARVQCSRAAAVGTSSPGQWRAEDGGPCARLTHYGGSREAGRRPLCRQADLSRPKGLGQRAVAHRFPKPSADTESRLFDPRRRPQPPDEPSATADEAARHHPMRSCERFMTSFSAAAESASSAFDDVWAESPLQ